MYSSASKVTEEALGVTQGYVVDPLFLKFVIDEFITEIM